MRLPPRLSTAALAAALCTPLGAASLEAQSVSFVNGATYVAPALTGFSTTGNLMGGMLVSWTYAGGGGNFASWGDIGGGLWGVDDGLTVSLGGGTDTFGGTWNVFNGTGQTITSIRFNGSPGRTLFDCDWNGTSCNGPGNASSVVGTTGSADGWTFQNDGGFSGASAQYANLFRLSGSPAVGDLYEQLTLSFADGLDVQASYAFIADTDNSPSDLPPPTRVPEPASLALLFTGLAGLAITRRRVTR